MKNLKHWFKFGIGGGENKLSVESVEDFKYLPFSIVSS